jgi:spore maturation protein CgeB
MKIVIFGLSVSSSWGNGHATIWRALCAALVRRKHFITFFERDTPYYARHRDLTQLPGGRLIIYQDWREVALLAAQVLRQSDVGMVTSFCPDGIEASDLVLQCAPPITAFYDLDTPVTLNAIDQGLFLSYLPHGGLSGFDVVFSYTGGRAIKRLAEVLGARNVIPLYGSVDPRMHYPVIPVDEYRCDLSYLGTYASDRQDLLRSLFVEPARRLSSMRFLLGGPLYPASFPWTDNIFYRQHVSPPEHPGFYCSSRLTLSITRKPMAESGYCPSGRLFEAAACGVPILSDRWEGIEQFFEPGREIIIAAGTDDVCEALHLDTHKLSSVALRARERTLAEHTADHRALEMEHAFENTLRTRVAAEEV